MRTRLGSVLVVLGTVLVAYALAVVLWGDPLTDLYARWQQRQLAAELDRAFVAYAGRPTAGGGMAEAEERFRRGLRLGEPLGRIVVPRLGLDEAFVHGTRWGPDLSRGPGHYAETPLPGSGRTVALAGHRTTFGAPFRKIDELERGDEIVVRMPYGAFRYRVFAHEIVASDDWSILRRRRFETLVLSACHPLWSSEQRWISYARLVSVQRARPRRDDLAAAPAAGPADPRK